MKPVVGFIGLGIMGEGMLGNIIEKGGYRTVIYNRSAEKCAPFAEKGATVASSPAQVVKEADVTVLMLANSDAVQWVLGGKDGALSGISSGKTLIDMGTNTPEFNEKVKDLVEERGGDYLEAPVLGSKVPAKEGTLTILVGGKEEKFEEYRELFGTMGKAIFYMGEVGKASQMKLIINQIMVGMLALFSEGLVAGERSGISAQKMLEVVKNSVLNCPLFSIKGPNMIISHDFSPHFPLKHAQKDLRQALSRGDKLAVPMPVTAAANSLYIMARDMGLGDEDFSAVIKTLMRGDGEVHIDI
ncbi:MAG: NAD(P)-dependent oxidoreductase [Deltaproteobacteria bacterium]|nr:MAG: NAD(P)-dependent oxidoreductase [Deltaproteobacteria bacterium]